MIKSSVWLLRFYKEWLAWADGEVEYNRSFTTYMGLCSCLDDWAWVMRSVDRKCSLLQVELREELKVPFPTEILDELKDQFKAAGLEVDYPFGGSHEFYQDVDLDSMHQNEVRLQWVRDRIRDMEVDNG